MYLRYNKFKKSSSTYCINRYLCVLGEMKYNVHGFPVLQTLTITLAYIISVYTLWSPERVGIFRVTSHILWLVITSFLASLSGDYRVYMFVVLQAFIITGFVLEVMHVQKLMRLKGKSYNLLFTIALLYQVIYSATICRSRSINDVSNT